MKEIYIFDFEVLAFDWCVVFKQVSTGEYTVIKNDNDALIAFMEREPFLGGFNNKHYDNHILKGLLLGYSPEVVRSISDDIILNGSDGWNHPLLKGRNIRFDSFDLMDDCQTGQSLKSIEAHLGLSIVESSIDFNIDRKLTDDEMDELITYCKFDVDATEKLYELRKPYLRTKAWLGESKGYSPEQSMYWTNAKLTSVYLDAEKPDPMYSDEREYKYPDKLKREYIPQEVFDFFDRIHDMSIPRDEVFTSKLEIEIGGCPCTVAYGGIHGAIPVYSEESTESRVIENEDVASYYPHLMILPLDYGKKYGYCSRSIHDPEIYVKTLEDRVQAKKSGDKEKNLALKLVLDVLGSSIKNSLNPTRGVTLMCC